MKPKQKYAETYNIGNTIIHVVAPSPLTDKEKQAILREHHLVGWSILEELEQKKKEQAK